MISSRKYKAICFDMGGTLLNTKVDYVKIANVIFDEMVRVGVPECVIDRNNGYRFNLEAGICYLDKQGRAGDVFRLSETAKRIEKNVEMEHVEESESFEGSLDLLKRIHFLGKKTGLLTGAYREYAVKACKICGVFDELDVIIARDDYVDSEAKPSPKAMEHLAEKLNVKTNEILFFGDHIYDLQCAEGSKTDFIGVLSGIYNKSDWEDLGVENIVSSVTDFYKDLLASTNEGP
ncbi:MAG: HAD family hydrolase [archaeon]|nr:HAD family hydrolase [archaeon]